MRSHADIKPSGRVRPSSPAPDKILRQAYITAEWNADGLSIFENVNWGMSLQLRNYWNLYGGGERNFEFYDDLDARGGPTIIKPANNFYYVGVNSDSRKRWGLDVGTNGQRDAVGGWQRSVNLGIRLQPSGRFQTNVGIRINKAVDSAQWIDNTDADGDTIEDNVYGTLKRNVLNITARGTYAFSRDMTLELYMQPFVAVGDYTNIRKLARPMSFDFTPVTLAADDDPDFNRKSLRGNVVLRWEYMRGSTLFVVWNMSTSDGSRPGVFSARRDLADAFRAPGSHVFVVKMNYWLSL